MLGLPWRWQVHTFMCSIWPCEQTAYRKAHRSAKCVEKGPLTKAARFFEKLKWIFCDRIQLKNSSHAIKYILCTYSVSSMLGAGVQVSEPEPYDQELTVSDRDGRAKGLGQRWAHNAGGMQRRGSRACPQVTPHTGGLPSLKSGFFISPEPYQPSNGLYPDSSWNAGLGQHAILG